MFNSLSIVGLLFCDFTFDKCKELVCHFHILCVSRLSLHCVDRPLFQQTLQFAPTRRSFSTVRTTLWRTKLSHGRRYPSATVSHATLSFSTRTSSLSQLECMCLSLRMWAEASRVAGLQQHMRQELRNAGEGVDAMVMAEGAIRDGCA